MAWTSWTQWCAARSRGSPPALPQSCGVPPPPPDVRVGPPVDREQGPGDRAAVPRHHDELGLGEDLVEQAHSAVVADPLGHEDLRARGAAPAAVGRCAAASDGDRDAVRSRPCRTLRRSKTGSPSTGCGNSRSNRAALAVPIRVVAVLTEPDLLTSTGRPPGDAVEHRYLGHDRQSPAVVVDPRSVGMEGERSVEQRRPGAGRAEDEQGSGRFDVKGSHRPQGLGAIPTSGASRGPRTQPLIPT